ncbi:MAG: hypothetical protein GY926_18185 [bacterium]|nr:hypothetical protein [bacterium]
MRYLMMTIVLALFLAACGAAAEDGGADSIDTTAAIIDAAQSETTAPVADGDAPAADATTTTVIRSEELSDDEKLPEPVPATDLEGGVVTDAIPEDLMANIADDVATRTSARAADMTLVRAEQAVWNDGSLGCPLPGESYTQAIVNGYWVVFELAGETYDYRASSSGFFKLCEGGGQPPSNPTG